MSTQEISRFVGFDIEKAGKRLGTRDDIRAYIEGITAQFPGLWKYFYPRWYTNTDKWLSAKLPAQCFFMCSLDVLGVTPTTPSQSETALFCVALKLAERRWPHFYVAPELFKAVSLTDPPEDTRWDDLPLPHEAALFMLPRRTLYHPTDGEVAWLAYARRRKGEPLDFKVGKHFWARECGNTTFTVCWECHEKRPNPPAFHTVLAADVNPYIRKDDIALSFNAQAGATIDQHWLAIPVTQGEPEFMQLCTSLVFRLLLIMQARPQLVEGGKPTGKRLSGAHQPEIWHPNIIGRTYSIPRRNVTSDPTAGGWHLRMHWRRGHLKQQPYGPKHELRKTLWIEAYVAGGTE